MLPWYSTFLCSCSHVLLYSCGQWVFSSWGWVDLGNGLIWVHTYWKFLTTTKCKGGSLYSIFLFFHSTKKGTTCSLFKKGRRRCVWKKVISDSRMSLIHRGASQFVSVNTFFSIETVTFKVLVSVSIFVIFLLNQSMRFVCLYQVKNKGFIFYSCTCEVLNCCNLFSFHL